jgi:hypothetical protein
MDAEFTMTGGTVEKNIVGGDQPVLLGDMSIAYGKGGGIYVEGSFITKGNCEITDNVAHLGGGGVNLERTVIPKLHPGSS